MMKIFVIGVAVALATGGAAMAQDHSAALGGSMGTQASATPQSTSASQASGAHHTPVAKAQRRHSGARGMHSAKSSSMSAGTGGSGDMTPSGNATANQQH